MRNRILLLLTLLLLGTAPAGWAQRDSLAVSSPGQHWEIQAVGGMHGMWKIPRKGKITVAPMVTPAFDITLSKWFSPQIGAGMGWQGSQMEHAGADRFSFAYIHAERHEFFWRLRPFPPLRYHPVRSLRLSAGMAWGAGH